MATAVTSMRIPTELNERYSRLAKETGRSRSFYVNEALQESIDRFEYEYGILKDIEDYRAGRLETYSIDEVRAHCGAMRDHGGGVVPRSGSTETSFTDCVIDAAVSRQDQT
jgi:RHH-type rel operon transcriptional repressor/antitoxin RelB